MFTAALFTIARTWKQPKCPSSDEWIRKMWYISLHLLPKLSEAVRAPCAPLSATTLTPSSDPHNHSQGHCLPLGINPQLHVLNKMPPNLFSPPASVSLLPLMLSLFSGAVDPAQSARPDWTPVISSPLLLNWDFRAAPPSSFLNHTAMLLKTRQPSSR